MNLVEHAKQEFFYAGYKPIEECENGPNKWIQENVLELLEVFSNQGHSGSSAPFAIEYFKKLAKFEPLTPITGADDEWDETPGSEGGVKTFQNKRLSSIFKDGKDGRPYSISAIAWRDEKGLAWLGFALKKDGSKVTSRQYIKLPFVNKAFFIDVIGKELKTGGREFYIKDEEQLKEVFEYYDFFNE
jgi:hypothetical protein